MPVATMTSKGQITIPKEMREDLGLIAGSKVMFIRLDNGQYRILPRTRRAQDLVGILHIPGQATITIEEMNRAIAEGWSGRELEADIDSTNEEAQ